MTTKSDNGKVDVITLEDGTVMSVADAAAMIAKARKQAEDKKAYVKEYCSRPEVKEERAKYRKEYFARDDVKAHLKENRQKKAGMLDSAIETECAKFANNKAVTKLHAEWKAAEGVKRGQLRTKLVAMIDALNG